MKEFKLLSGFGVHTIAWGEYTIRLSQIEELWLDYLVIEISSTYDDEPLRMTRRVIMRYSMTKYIEMTENHLAGLIPIKTPIVLIMGSITDKLNFL